MIKRCGLFAKIEWKLFSVVFFDFFFMKIYIKYFKSRENKIYCHQFCVHFMLRETTFFFSFFFLHCKTLWIEIPRDLIFINKIRGALLYFTFFYFIATWNLARKIKKINFNNFNKFFLLSLRCVVYSIFIFFLYQTIEVKSQRKKYFILFFFCCAGVMTC